MIIRCNVFMMELCILHRDPHLILWQQYCTPAFIQQHLIVQKRGTKDLNISKNIYLLENLVTKLFLTYHTYHTAVAYFLLNKNKLYLHKLLSALYAVSRLKIIVSFSRVFYETWTWPCKGRKLWSQCEFGVMMNMYGKQGRNRSLYGTVRSMVPSRGTPVTGMDDMVYTPPYFYHIPPPPQPLNTYPGRKRRKKVCYSA